ncbi:MAG: hypothetical protein B5M46_05475, partial [Epsilonproteobacteria bacterium 4484_20]
FEKSDLKKEDDKRDEVFIVGLYMEDETARNLLSEDFNLTRTKFDLLFSSEVYGERRLHFAKKAKYVFTKEAF